MRPIFLFLSLIAVASTRRLPVANNKHHSMGAFRCMYVVEPQNVLYSH